MNLAEQRTLRIQKPHWLRYSVLSPNVSNQRVNISRKPRPGNRNESTRDPTLVEIFISFHRFMGCTPFQTPPVSENSLHEGAQLASTCNTSPPFPSTQLQFSLDRLGFVTKYLNVWGKIFFPYSSNTTKTKMLIYRQFCYISRSKW